MRYRGLRLTQKLYVLKEKRDLKQLTRKHNMKFFSADTSQTDRFLISSFALCKKFIIDCSLSQFTEDAGRPLDGDLRRRSLDFIDIICISFLEDLEARLDV